MCPGGEIGRRNGLRICPSALRYVAIDRQLIAIIDHHDGCISGLNKPAMHRVGTNLGTAGCTSAKRRTALHSVKHARFCPARRLQNSSLPPLLTPYRYRRVVFVSSDWMHNRAPCILLSVMEPVKPPYVLLQGAAPRDWHCQKEGVSRESSKPSPM